MFDFTKTQSSPAHPKDKHGICLVVGTHPDWVVDFDAAFKSAYEQEVEIEGICAINDATDLVQADYLATVHPEKISQFLSDVQHPIEIHSRDKMKRPDPQDHEYVWGIKYGGGSALFAVMVMLSIGYDQVVMCGCPMNGGDGYAIRKHKGSDTDPRFGDMDASSELVQGYHRAMRNFVENSPEAKKVRSMSGITKQIFGEF